jgi:hypothetical protein
MNDEKSPANQHEKFLHAVKENYVRRIDEIDAFSKRLSNMCVEVNTEFLYGCLDVSQHCLDLQKKYSSQFPWIYSPDLMTNVIKQNTDAWIHTVQNIDETSIETLKNLKNSLKSFHKNSVLLIDNTDRIFDIYEKNQPNKENETGTEIIENLTLVSSPKEPNLN